jgi:protein required for attachment to host cells
MTLNRHALHEPPVRLDWLVIANAARARVFERDGENGALRETADALHPASRAKGAALGRDRPGQVHKGAMSTAFEPRAEPHAREHVQFAHELAAMLERAALAGRLPALVLMASNPFLGELKAAIGPAARAVLRFSVALDLTHFQGAELEDRVRRAWTEAVGAPPPA